MKNEFDQNRKIFTSESVTEGHPDKVCDQIGDAILDDILAQDPNARVACEVCATTGLVLVMGEITTTGYCDVQKIVRKTVEEIGYNRGKFGFDAENLAVLVSLNEQSPDIALGVDADGAGDQGMMFGYACRETEEYMPLPITLAHKLARRLAAIRKDGSHKELRPDGKTQVSVEYDENGKPLRIDTIVVSTQHDEEVSQEYLREMIIKDVITPIIPKELMDENTKIFVNPTGRFVVGGPKGDSGLTGRKIIVDTYGGYAPHGGGSFSGKDPTKVDRSASYMARYVAKNMVAAGFADRMQIQLSYAIGVAKPISICIDTFNTSKYTEKELIDIVNANFDLTPKGIISTLDLRRPIYRQTATYGHFGRNDLDLPWEKLDKVETLKKYLK
ncbi:s-adenosylmethionine synthase [Firmicutes bacterium CAG:313]|jgi:methionine adenosyltransferase|nr:s-adenosylmethionine synthase [Firmicutes bacterium CAG:313]